MDAELKARAEGRIGTTIRDKYRVDALLGIGGMAAVYKVTHRNRAEFAIKMLHPELSVRESFRQRFLREGYAANTVKHPGVVAVVDEDVAEDGSAFLVMELLSGVSVHDLAKANGGRVPVQAAAAILDQLLDVLGVAHTHGIIHRDIKPANLFLTRDGTLKVLDFGIARVREGLTDDANATGTGVLLGTPGFMAPEQAVGNQEAIGPRTDLWAAGATFFTLVSGKFVHLGENSAQLLVAAATAAPRSVQSVAVVPPTIGAIVDRALDFDASCRWASAAEMQNALRVGMQEAFGGPPPRSLLAQCATSPGSVSAQVPVALGSIPSGGITSPATMLQTGQPVAANTAPRALAPKGGSAALKIAALAVLAISFFVVVQRVGSMVGPEPAPSAVPMTVGAPQAAATAVGTAQPSAAATAATERPTTEARPPPGHATKKKPHARPKAATLTNCDPPYYFDADNNKVFKKECL